MININFVRSHQITSIFSRMKPKSRLPDGCSAPFSCPQKHYLRYFNSSGREITLFLDFCIHKPAGNFIQTLFKKRKERIIDIIFCTRNYPYNILWKRKFIYGSISEFVKTFIMYKCLS